VALALIGFAYFFPILAALPLAGQVVQVVHVAADLEIQVASAISLPAALPWLVTARGDG
jgi:hypothetical protein